MVCQAWRLSPVACLRKWAALILSQLATGKGRPQRCFEAATKRLRALLKVFANRHFISGSQNLVGITFSAGVAVYPEDGVELQHLRATADRRLYEAKRAGRERVHERDFLVEAVANIAK